MDQRARIDPARPARGARTAAVVGLAGLAVIAGGVGSARADDGLALLATGGWMVPRGDVGESYGGGAEARMIDDVLTVGFGASALVGRTPAARRRDVMDVYLNVGVRLCERCRALAPYTALGLDVLHVTTSDPARSVRGSTLGLSGHVGLMGRLGGDGDGDRGRGAWMWRASASYLGAIVPGTGEDLGGVTLSVAIGKHVFR